MTTLGSITLITGLGGLVIYMMLLTLKPRFFPKSLSVAVITILLATAGLGLVLLTMSTGDRSLQTGG